MSTYSKNQKDFYDHHFRTLASKKMEENIRNFYFQKITSLLDNKMPDVKTALEIGCGNGLLLEKMAKHYPHCKFKGVDISSKNIQEAGAKGLNAQVADAENLDPKESYDLIYGSAILHHLQNVERFLGNIQNNLNPNGIILFAPEPVAYAFLYIAWHKFRGIWEIEKGMLNITEKKINKYLCADFKNITITRHGNIFVYSFQTIGKFWNFFGFSKIPAINDIYIYGEKKTSRN